MQFFARLFPDLSNTPPRERSKLLAMMGLFFLVVCAVGILRPIKNSLALDGLGATAFYKVYLVSAAVVLFAPVYTGLARRVAWRILFPLAALFFASNLVVLRTLYVPGSAAFGIVFYGWYDLFAAALVTQFFMATQLFFNARSAKEAYPLVIGGGALGATTGGMITGLLAERIGTPNLMLVAAGFIVLFAAGLPFIYSGERGTRETTRGQSARVVDALWKNKHVRMIAASVLLTIIVKELVDYQFNALSKEVFVTRDEVAAFQGKFNAVTQWLPLAFVMLLHPLLKRFGVGLAILLLPIGLLVSNVALAIWWGIAAASVAKGAETAFRYSAERAGREILYLPVPADVRLTAKAYIDVAIEKGLGKALSAVLIFLLLRFISYEQIVYLTIALALLAMVVAVQMRREYVTALADAMQSRLVSLRGAFASILDAATLPRVRAVLRSDDALQVAFALDLLEQGSAAESRSVAEELRELLRHRSDTIRERAAVLLARVAEPENAPALEASIHDPVMGVREAAARALVASVEDGESTVLRILKGDDAAARAAILAQLPSLRLNEEAQHQIADLYANGRQHGDDRNARIERAYAAQALGDEGWRVLLPLLSDADPDVINAALRAAGALRSPELIATCVRALRASTTRVTARNAVLSYGDDALPVLSTYLLDTAADPLLRRQIPSLLAQLPSEEVIATLLRAISARETDQVLDFRAVKALSKLRNRHPTLAFPRAGVQLVLKREAEAADRYARARQILNREHPGSPAVVLMMQALTEAWRERRESSFRILALIESPAAVLNAYSAVCGSDTTARANAIEWLEQQLGYELTRVLAPVLAETQQNIARHPGDGTLLAELADDEDSWIAVCARAVTTQSERNIDMEIIERVFMLQRIDLLQGARSAHLALLAAIAEPIAVDEDDVLLERGRPVPAMFVVIRGAVELEDVTGHRTIVQDGGAFGTWALIDDANSMISARATERSDVLRIKRADFFDVLEDTPELAVGLLQGLARRVRTLVA